MSTSPVTQESTNGINIKDPTHQVDIERQFRANTVATKALKSLGAGVSRFHPPRTSTPVTTLSLSLMEWRGVTTANLFVGNFFISAFGLVVTAHAFGLFYAGYGAIFSPAFGILGSYNGDTTQYNNALGLFMILWTVFVFTFLIGSLPSNLAYIAVFFLVDMGFLTVAASYFAEADGHHASSVVLKKAGGGLCFVAGLVGWYIEFHLLLKDAALVELPLGNTSRFFGKRVKKTE